MRRIKAHYRRLYSQSLRFLRQVCNGSVLHQGGKNVIKDFGCTLESIVCLILKKKKGRTKPEVGTLFCCFVLQTLKMIFATFKIFHLSSQSHRETKIFRTLLSRNSPSLNANAISDTLSTAFWHKKLCSDLHFSNAAETHEIQHTTGLSLYERTEMQPIFYPIILKSYL